MQNTRKPSGQYNKDKGSDAPRGKYRKGMPARKKVCRFCADKLDIDYKNIGMLRAFMTDSGKMLPGRATGTCARHQRKLDIAIKRARMLAMLPFCVSQ
jgi:small subunit ribosomal protein S18